MTARTVIYRLRAEATQFQAQMRAAGASVTAAADRMTDASQQSAQFREGLTTLGDTAGKVGLVAAAGLGAAVKKAADFDAAMSSVEAATGETAATMERLRQAALDAGAQTAFSATEAAAGIENLAKAGVSAEAIMGGALAGALDLAAAGEMEVADAAEAAAGAMAQFGLSGDQVPHIADLLAAAAGKAQGEVSDMVFALKQAGTVSAQTGLTLEETTGALAAMAEQSLLGSDAGTSFKTMLSALTPNSKKAADAMAEYNIHAFDAQGNFVGMTELAGQLEAGLGGLTNEQRAMALETIFGSDAVRAAAIVYDNGAEGIAKWTAAVDEQGFAAETAATRLDNLKGDLEALGGAFETALIGTGDGAQGPLRSLTQGLTNATNAYNNLGDGAKSGVAITLAATAGIGAGLFVFSRVVQSIAATRAALTQLGVTATTTSKLMGALGKAGFGLAGLAAAGLAVDALRKSLEESLPGTSQLTGQILEISDGKIAALSSEFDSLSSSISRMNPNYVYRSSDAILGLLTLGQVDGKEIDGARQEIEALDAAMANIATSGGTEVATKAFEDLAEAQGLSSEEQKELLKLLPGYKEALAANENQISLTATSTTDMANETADLGDALTVAERQVENFKNVLDGLNGILDQRGNVRSYQAAIDDFTDSLTENGNTFDINTEKGRNNQAALDGIAGSALSVAEGLGTAARKKFLTNAISDIRTLGENMNLPKAEIARLIELLQRANKTDVKPKVDVNAVEAMSAIERVRNALLGIKDKSVTVRVTQTGAGVTPGFGPQANAEGGFISGPGTATSDSIPSYLSNGEYVVKAAAVDKYGVHMFDRLNAMHFATGGSVSKKGDKRKPQGGLAVTTDVEALQDAVDRLTMAAEGQTRALDDATAKQEFWASKMSDLAQATVAGFNTGLFEKSDNPWADGAGGGPLGNLAKDIAGLQERSGLQSQLAALGLSGDALSALLSEGTNSDISALLNSGQVSQYADLYNQRAALQGSVGASAGQQAYGAELAAASREQRAATEIARQSQQQLTVMTNRLEYANELLARIPDSFAGAISGPATKASQSNPPRKNGGKPT